VAVQDKIDALHKIRHTTEDERRTEPEMSALYATQGWLLDRIEADAVPPATLAGVRAMARTSVAIASPNVKGEPSCDGGDSQWLAFAVVKFLAAGGAA
jgi:hypothetical protein